MTTSFGKVIAFSRGERGMMVAIDVHGEEWALGEDAAREVHRDLGKAIEHAWPTRIIWVDCSVHGVHLEVRRATPRDGWVLEARGDGLWTVERHARVRDSITGRIPVALRVTSDEGNIFSAMARAEEVYREEFAGSIHRVTP